MNKFEKLIEYVINDEDSKASDLFHEIVVDKSRQIYEDLMELELGGDEVDEFIDDVEADEEGISAEVADDESDEFDFDDSEEISDESTDEELEDRVVDLEDKIDELMAEFDTLMAGDSEEVVDMGVDELGAEEELSFEESADADAELEDDEDKEELDESAELEAAPKPTTSEEGSVNTKSANADDAGKKAKTDARPVSTSTTTEKGRTAPKAKEMDVDGPEGGAELTKAPALKRGE